MTDLKCGADRFGAVIERLGEGNLQPVASECGADRRGVHLPVALERPGAAGALAHTRVAPAARARVGRSDEEERGWEPQRTLDAIDGDGALLEGLAQALDRRARELGELVED
ncbi:MAG TPA: hypothetical protein VHN14_21040 [Kofleriaceae bacterium]|nr:hypothetical protein [Kofleriaceae bacterium]